MIASVLTTVRVPDWFTIWHRQLSFAAYCISLAVIVALGTMLQTDFEITVPQLEAHRSSGQFTDATVNAYGDTANLRYRLLSHIVHYRRDGRFEFVQPKLIYRSATEQPLTIRAQRGYMEHDFRQLELRGDVEISRFNPQTQIPESLLSDNATVDFETKKAYTADRVTFRQYNKVTEGMGMDIDLVAQTVALRSDVNVLLH